MSDNERDELARELFIIDNHKLTREQCIEDWGWFITTPTPHNGVGIAKYIDAADKLRTIGYRKPRTITTAEELDALPRDSVVLGFGLGERTPYLRAVSARGIITWGCVGSTDCHDSAHLLLDGVEVTVLFEPTP